MTLSTTSSTGTDRNCPEEIVTTTLICSSLLRAELLCPLSCRFPAEFRAAFNTPWATFPITGCTLRWWWNRRSRWCRWRPGVCLRSIIFFIVAQGGYESRSCQPPKLTWRKTSLNGSKTPSKVLRTLCTFCNRPSVPYQNKTNFALQRDRLFCLSFTS